MTLSTTGTALSHLLCSDAAHIALATLFGAVLVVSWNFAVRGGEELKRDKTFDCVQMKTGIQERLLREIADFGEEEAARLRRERLAHDPILGAFLDRRTAGSGPRTERTPAA